MGTRTSVQMNAGGFDEVASPLEIGAPPSAQSVKVLADPPRPDIRRVPAARIGSRRGDVLVEASHERWFAYSQYFDGNRHGTKSILEGLLRTLVEATLTRSRSQRAWLTRA